MSRVNLDFSVWTDVRILSLAKDLGILPMDAVGRCARVWAECTFQGSYFLSKDHIDLITHVGFADALVRARLGTKKNLKIYISGTRGRIEWIRNLRKNASKGGLAKAKRRVAMSLAKGSKNSSNFLADPCPPAPAPAPAKGTKKNNHNDNNHNSEFRIRTTSEV